MKQYSAADFSRTKKIRDEKWLQAVYPSFAKRAFDLSLAIFLLPVLVPVIVILWALSRMDGGPGFYHQKRVGLNGKQFNCWKMRTMVVNAERVLDDLCKSDPKIATEWLENQKLDNDPRITKVGAFLRATSLDELPQIWNVLMGDMSFVGPRPFMAQQELLYRAAGGEAYFHMRPGITGIWQIEGRGETSFVDRIRFDNAYFRELSFKRDAGLILKTIGVVLNRTGK